MTNMTRSETARKLARRLRDPHELSVFGSRALMADAAQLLDEFAALLDAPPAALGSYQFTLGKVALTGHAADIGYGIYEQLLDPVLRMATRGLRELHAQRPDALLPAQLGLLSGLLGAIGGRLAADFGAATAAVMLQATSRAARQVELEDAAGKGCTDMASYLDKAQQRRQRASLACAKRLDDAAESLIEIARRQAD